MASSGMRLLRHIAALLAVLQLGASPALAQLDDAQNEHRLAEQTAALALVPDGSETVVAVADGLWSDTATWSGEVPVAGARVLIPEGRTVRYDVAREDILASLRIDGALVFVNDRETALSVDTMVVTHPGRLELGTESDPIRAEHPARITFADAGQTSAARDLGLGLLSFGAVTMHGEAKSAFHRLATMPAVGTTTAVLEEAPFAWQVGDRILFSSTMPSNRGGLDEVVTITGIDGTTLTFEPALAAERPVPSPDHRSHVANLSRSITFASADPTLRYRGHVQLMHRRDVDVRYASFVDLGRSDRLSEYGEDNVPERYPLYVHGSTPGLLIEEPVKIIGAVVERSPAHGIAAHTAHLLFEANVVSDVAGGGFLAMSGNETGAMRRNLASNTRGYESGAATDPKDSAGSHNFAGGGVGFWFQSRVLYDIENVAANSMGDGFVYFHRGSVFGGGVLREHIDHDAAAHYKGMGFEGDVGIDKPVIQGFHDNESYGIDGAGLHIIKNSPIQLHDDRTMLEGFSGWNVQSGVSLDYTGHYLLRQFRLYAHTESKTRPWGSSGVSLGQSIVDIVCDDFHVEGFSRGVHVLFNSAEAKRKYNSIPSNVHLHAFTFVDDDTNVQLNEHDPSHLTLHDVALVPTAPSLVFDPSGDLRLGEEPDFQSYLTFVGTRADTLGASALLFGTGQEIELERIRNPYEMAAGGLVTRGLYTAEDGTRIALFDWVVSDRFTGAQRRYQVPITVDRQRWLDTGVDAGPITTFDQGGIRWVNHAAYPMHDWTVTDRAVPVELSLLDNDSDVDGDVFEVVALGEPAHGAVEDLGAGRVRYVPNSDHVGVDAFTYTILDEGSGRTATGLCRIDVFQRLGAAPIVPPDVDAGPAGDAGAGADAGIGPDGGAGEDGDGCACRTGGSGGSPGFGLALLALLALVTVRRR